MSHAQVEQLFQQGRYQEAWWLYSGLASAGDVVPELHVTGAMVAHKLGHLHSALAVAEKALARATGDTRGVARFIHANLLRDLGRHEEAVAEFAAWIADFDQYRALEARYLGTAHYNLGLTLRELERYSESVAQYRIACDQFRRHGPKDYLCLTLQNLAWAACLGGDAKSAAHALGEAEPLCRTPEAPWHQRIGRAFLHLVTGNPYQALQLCQSIIDHTGNDLPLTIRSHAYWLAGRAALALGQTETARALAEQALWLGAAVGEDTRCLRDAARLVSETGYDPEHEVVPQLQRWGAIGPDSTPK